MTTRPRTKREQVKLPRDSSKPGMSRWKIVTSTNEWALGESGSQLKSYKEMHSCTHSSRVPIVSTFAFSAYKKKKKRRNKHIPCIRLYFFFYFSLSLSFISVCARAINVYLTDSLFFFFILQETKPTRRFPWILKFLSASFTGACKMFITWNFSHTPTDTD